MNEIHVIIFPDQFTELAVRTDAALVNLSKKMVSAGFFEKRKFKKLAQQFVNMKTALIMNPQHSLVISADLAEKIFRYSTSGEVLNISGFRTDDGLFDFDGGVAPNED